MALDRRYNWKENISKQAQKRLAAKLVLLSQLEDIRESIRLAGLDFKRYDELKQTEREIIAQLATL